LTPLAAFVAVASVMYVELRISRRHERLLRASGAHEPPGDVYRWMRLVYPAAFLAMTVEGLASPPGPTAAAVAGLVVLAAAKALKFWAIASLGVTWSFRVLVRPGEALVTTGPYRYLRHPNYLAIVGELTGMALLVRAPITGALSLISFGLLLRRRIAVEERALGLRAGTD
jgi:methyltransferase